MKRKTTLWIVEGIIVLIALVGLSWVMLPKFILAQKNLNTSFHFPDETFRKFITKALRISPSEPFTKEDCEAITGDLDCKELGIKDLTGIEYFTRITGLNASHNEITKIDVSQNTGLGRLVLDFNQIEAIDLSHNPHIRMLSLKQNRLSELDASNQSDLCMLFCGGNQLTQLSFHPRNRIILCSCSRNQLTELDLSTLSNLRILHCDHNRIQTIDISKNPMLNHLDVSHNLLTDVKPFLNHPDLKKVNASNNQLNYDDWEDIQELDRQLKANPGDSKLYKFTYSPQTGIDPYQP